MLFRILFFASLLFFTKNIFAQSANVPAETVYSSEVYFDFGKHELQSGSDSVFTNISKLVADKADLLVRITAHTDSIGSLQNNLALSQRRGNAVKNKFLEMGIPDSFLQIADFGETKPAATNSNEIGRQKNRRATIEVLKFTKPPALPKKEPAMVLAQPEKILLKGKIVDAENGNGLQSTVIIRSKEWQDTLYTDSSGLFQKQLQIGIVVGVDAFSECHFFASQMLKTKPEMPPLEMKLKPALTGKALDLNKLYFIGGQPVLVEKSKPELPKILRFVQSNPEMKIEIAGHVNLPNQPPISKMSKNFKLSKDRAWVVYDYLLKKGIPKERISFKGYGNWEMRFPNAYSAKQQALNRRVEIRVLEGGCE